MDIYEKQKVLGHGSFGEVSQNLSSFIYSTKIKCHPQANLVKSKINQKLYVIKSIRLSSSATKNVSVFSTRCPNKFQTGVSKKSLLNVTKSEKLVKVCLHSSQAVQISLQFDEFFRQKISKFYFHKDLRFSVKLFI